MTKLDQIEARAKVLYDCGEVATAAILPAVHNWNEHAPDDIPWLIGRVRKLVAALEPLTAHCCCVVPPDDGEDQCSNPDCVSFQARQALDEED